MVLASRPADPEKAEYYDLLQRMHTHAEELARTLAKRGVHPASKEVGAQVVGKIRRTIESVFPFQHPVPRLQRHV